MAGSFFTSVAVNLVSRLGECLFAPIGRQFGYVLCHRSYIEELKNGVQELESARETVQQSVNEATRNIKPIYTYVQDWLGNATKKTEEAQHLLERGESARNACFRGWIPNPLVRHRIGRQVRETTEAIQGLLHEKSRNGNFKKVSYENTPPGIVTDTTSNTRSVGKEGDALESRALIMEDVMKALADDKVRVVGVYGPGGVGKSKLLADIKERVMGVKGKKLFDEVAMADVSRNPDPRRIQGEIADALGLKFVDVETARGRAELLHQRLNGDPKKSIIILLDNLWKKVDLKEVGIPCGDDNKVTACKLLLTSRYREVLRTDMGSDQDFQLSLLEDGEALRLFERIVGDTVNDPECKSMTDGVVKNCGGLPLLILSEAKRLKHGELAAWRNALNNREGSDAKSIVEQNYNELKDERIKSLFLVCALASGTISMRDALIYSTGLGLFKKFSETIQNTRDRLIADLRSLQDYSLLLESDGMEQFKMHDVFVDEAISIASTEWNALVGVKGNGFKQWSKDELRKCTAISFPYVAIDELPEKLYCPNLRVLLLCEHNPSLKIPESIFETMEKLEVLDFSGLSFASLPTSIGLLENLKSLSLDFCHLGDVTILGKLIGLQFLILHGSKIARLPREIGKLAKLRFLDLRACVGLKIIEPGVLGSMVDLEELYVGDNFHQWEAEDKAPRSNASLAELNNMENLSTLEIAIPHSASLSRDLPFGKLVNHKIQIGGVWGWSNKQSRALQMSRTLQIRLDANNLLHEVWMQECLGRTHDLQLDGLQDRIDSIHDLCTKGFQELKHLRVRNNSSFQYVVNSTRCPVFTRLESLVLKNLNNLEKLCNGRLSERSFSELKIVKVEYCSEIKHLFHSFIAINFLQLEEIEIMECHSIQQIVADAEADEYIYEIDDDANAKSFKLRRLTLQDLPEITSFCKTKDDSVAFFDGQQINFMLSERVMFSFIRTILIG